MSQSTNRSQRTEKTLSEDKDTPLNGHTATEETQSNPREMVAPRSKETKETQTEQTQERVETNHQEDKATDQEKKREQR